MSDPAAPSARLADWTSARAATALGGATALLPVGAVEPHGPHLPLGTDVILAEEVARRAAVRLARGGVSAIVAPAIPFSVTEFARDFAGGVSVSADAVTAYLRDVALGLLRAGASRVVVVTLHFDPGHLAAVHAAVRAACASRPGDGAPPVLLADFTRRASAARIGGEFATGSCHAGSFETSLVLAARPDLVDDTRRRALPELPVELPRLMKAGATSFLECGMADAYCGAPAAASAAEGESLYSVLAEIVAEAATSG